MTQTVVEPFSKPMKPSKVVERVLKENSDQLLKRSIRGLIRHERRKRLRRWFQRLIVLSWVLLGIAISSYCLSKYLTDVPWQSLVDRWNSYILRRIEETTSTPSRSASSFRFDDERQAEQRQTS